MGFFAVHSPTVLWFTLPVLLYIARPKVVNLALIVVNVIEVKTVFVIGKIPISVRSDPLIRLSFLRFSRFHHFYTKKKQQCPVHRFTKDKFYRGKKGSKKPLSRCLFFFLMR